MMGRSLLIVGLLGTIGVAVTGALGFGLHSPADPGMTRHVVAALAASLPVLFSHCWILLYLLGTGKLIRDSVRESGLEEGLLAQSRRLRRVCYAWLLLAAGLLAADFLVGGAVASSAAKPWVHQALFWTAIAAQGIALWAEWRSLAANELLLGEVDQRLVAAAPAA